MTVTRALSALVLMLVTWSSVLLITWWLIGDVSYPGGSDQILSLPTLEEQAGPLALAGLVGLVASVSIAMFVLAQRRRWKRMALAMCMAAVTGVWCGFSLRVISSRTDGANIGGSALTFVAPGPSLLLLSIAAAVAFDAINQAN
jgi:hypothetical protein